MPEPKRPRWRRKRTWAALLAWFLAAYAASVGPAVYAYTRGWISRPLIDAAYTPLWKALPDSPEPQMGLERYMNWWQRLAERHEAASDRDALTTDLSATTNP